MTPLPTGRLYYLDALRAFAILYGILVHVATLGAPSGLAWISLTSGYFRMGLFFLVSGYFAAMTMRKLSTGDFLRKRSIALLVPLVTGLVLLNPFTNWLVMVYHNGPMPFWDSMALPFEFHADGIKGPAIWHLHLWFLISLYVYVVTAPVVVWLARRVAGVLSHVADRLSGLPASVAILAVALGVALASTALRVAYHVTLAPWLDDTILLWLGPTTMYYWPFFLAGMAFFAAPALAARFQSVSLPALAVGLAVAYAGVRINLPGPAGETVRIFCKAFCTTTNIAAIMAVFRLWFAAPGRLSRTAGYVYSIYIMHFLVIYLIAHTLRPLGLGPYATFFAVAGLTYVTVFALHHFVIARSAVLEFLLNGKPLRVRQPA